MIILKKITFFFIFLFFIFQNLFFIHKLQGKSLKYFYYTVKPKDTVYSISKRFNVTIDLLKILNPNLNEEKLGLNQKLLILNRIDGVFYQVKKGDTIFSIAKKYDISKNTLLIANEIESIYELEIGKNLFIPGDIKNFSNSNNKDFKSERKNNNLIKLNFFKPINGKLVGNVGLRFHPIKKRIIFHSGIDIKAPYGKAVYSTYYGKVTFSGYKPGYGNLVIVEHENEWSTYYGHLSKIYVKENQKVSPNIMIGRVGMSGITTGPHLHFEIRYKGIPQKILNNRNIPQFYGKIGKIW